MPRLVRIKRRMEEEPAPVLYLACKRARKSDGSSEAPKRESLTLTFAGTVNPKGSPAPKAETEDLVPDTPVRKRVRGGKCRLKPVPGKVEPEFADLAGKEEEEEVVEGACAAPKRKAVELYDVVLEDENDVQGLVQTKKIRQEEDAITCNGVEMEVRETDPEVAAIKRIEFEFVYDLYLLPDVDPNEYVTELDPVFYLETDPYLSDMSLYGEYRDIIEGNDDDEDSNAEDNPANDYPDEEDEEAEESNYYCSGVDEELRAFESLTMGGFYNDEDEGSEEDWLGDEDCGFDEEGIGSGYSSYLARVTKEMADGDSELRDDDIDD